jgi:hypothetical protein
MRGWRNWPLSRCDELRIVNWQRATGRSLRRLRQAQQATEWAAPLLTVRDRQRCRCCSLHQRCRASFRMRPIQIDARVSPRLSRHTTSRFAASTRVARNAGKMGPYRDMRGPGFNHSNSKYRAEELLLLLTPTPAFEGTATPETQTPWGVTWAIVGTGVWSLGRP